MDIINCEKSAFFNKIYVHSHLRLYRRPCYATTPVGSLLQVSAVKIKNYGKNFSNSNYLSAV